MCDSTRPTGDPRGPTAGERAVLIALNRTEALSRVEAFRFADRLRAWWPPAGRAVPPDLGDPELVARARAVAVGAAETVAREERAASALGATIVVRGEPAYPAELELLSHPPPVLYVRGELPAGGAVAIVGPRAADGWALDAAGWFAGELAERGLVVISGFARGVDAAAHRAALAAPGGRTVAVLGCGLDVPYPREHHRMAGEIAARGAVLTEFPLGREPERWHFPVRNRLLAALAAATLVVQASDRSGALITARCALDLGREVLALPGRLGDRRCAGSNRLLRDGAHVALEPDDVVLALPLAARPPTRRAERVESADPLLAILSRAPCGADELARSLEIPIDRVLVRLAELELLGEIERQPGATFGRVRAKR